MAKNANFGDLNFVSSRNQIDFFFGGDNYVNFDG
jgi:hypothetical protein